MVSARTIPPAALVTAGIIVFIGFMLLSNWLFSGIRLDLTSTRTYTVSAGTKHILKTLEEPIHIRFFYSRNLASTIPMVQSYGTRILELLRTYTSLSHGKLTLEVVDPEPFSPEEDQAVSVGISAIPVSDNGEKLYFGLALANGAGDLKTIPFLDPQHEAFLEYDLTHGIHQLTLSKKLNVGILTSINLDPTPQNMLSPGESWSFLDRIREQYTVKMLKADGSPVPKNIDLLMVIHPTDFDAKTQDAIDQYILAGGKTFIAVDPYLEIPGLKNTRSDLPLLFKNWQVNYNPDQVVLDGLSAVQIPVDDGSSTLQRLDKLNWLRLSNANLNQEDITTSTLNIIHYVSGGTLSLASSNTPSLSAIPLISTSDQTMVVKTVDVMDAQSLLQHFVPDNKTLPLAIHLTGTAKTAFPDIKTKNHLATSASPIHVVIVADVDMLRDQFWLQKQRMMGRDVDFQIADNASFVMNTLDAFSGGDDLISLRSRNLVDRPFIVVNQLRQKASTRFLAEEEQLKNELKTTDEKLIALQKNRTDNKSEHLTAEEQAEIDAFRNAMINTRAKLRDVQHRLDRDIERLGSWLKLIHIGVIPGLVILLALWLPRRIGRKQP